MHIFILGNEYQEFTLYKNNSDAKAAIRVAIMLNRLITSVNGARYSGSMMVFSAHLTELLLVLGGFSFLFRPITE